MSSNEAGALKDTALKLFQGLAATYERVLDVATLTQDRYWKRWVAEEVRAQASDLVLDIGCGTCLLEERLEATGCAVVGLDLTVPMILVGQAKKLRCIKILAVGDAESLPFADESFDAVVSCYVPKYVNLRRFTSEVSRVLRPGGRVVLYDFVRPRGFFLPFVGVYVHGVMRAVGTLLRLTKSDVAFTLRNLPRIVQGATWDALVAPYFAMRGVNADAMKRLTGGVVAAYAGTKVPRSPAERGSAKRLGRT